MKNLMLKLVFPALSGVVILSAAHAQASGPVPPLKPSQPVPAELAQMVADFNAAVVSKDLDRIESFYSERYLHDGRPKKDHRSYVDGWVHYIPGFDLRLTSFRPVSGDLAYISAEIHMGAMRSYKAPDYQIVRENGQWKWLGNQQQ